jgi:hypothetical protein
MKKNKICLFLESWRPIKIADTLKILLKKKRSRRLAETMCLEGVYFWIFFVQN